MNADEKISRVTARQYGVFSREQAFAAGFSESGINRRLKQGRWDSSYKGVYRLPGVPESWHQKLMAAYLLAGPNAVVSHRSAAQLLRFAGAPEGYLELTLPADRRSPPGVVFHTTDTLPMSDVVRIGPFKLTSVTRTLIDYGGVVDEEMVEIALEDALHHRKTTLSRISRRLETLSANGRNGAGVLKRVLTKRAPAKRPAASLFETKFFRMLRELGLPLPERQYEVCHDGEFIARPDYAYPNRKLAIECESREHHEREGDWERDVKRFNELAAVGWPVIRVTWSDLKSPEALRKCMALAFSLPQQPVSGGQRREKQKNLRGTGH